MTYVGIDIGGTNLKAGLVDEDGHILSIESIKIASVSEQDELIEALVTMTKKLASDVGITIEDIPAILKTGVTGIALSGTILRAEDPVEETRKIVALVEK